MSVVGAKEFRTERFRGLNLRDDDLDDEEARDLLNVVGKPRGGVRTRDGSSRFASAALTSGVLPANYRFLDVWPVGYQKTTSLRSISGGVVNKDAKPALLGVAYDRTDPDYLNGGRAGVKLISVFGDGTVVDHGTIDPYGSVAGQEGNGRIGVATGPGFIYVYWAGTIGDNGRKIGGASDTPANWTASAGTIPLGNLLKWWSGRMFVTAIKGQPARVQASTIGDPDYWSTTADANGNKSFTVDLEPGDGDVIVGWGAFDTYLIVFKRRRCWVIYDGDSGANRVLSPQMGATSRYAIAETPYGVCFQTRDNSIWIATGTRVSRISEKVDPWLNSPAALGFADDKLYVSVPDGIPVSPSSGTFEYDFITEEWRRHSFVATQFAMQDFDDGAGQKLFGLVDPTTAGKNLVRYLDPAVNDDLGTAYDSYWASAHRKFGTEVLKRISELRVEGTGQVDVSFSKEHSSSEEFQRSLTLQSASSTWGQGSVLTPGVARSWGFRFKHSGSGYMSLDAYAANVKARRS